MLKADFPLAAGDVRTRARGARASRPRARARAPTRSTQLRRRAGRAGARPARGRRCTSGAGTSPLGGCMAELTELSTDNGADADDRRRVRGSAARARDGARASASIAVPNVSFPRALQELAGFGARRFAVIDVGTNSVKFLVGERCEDGGWRTIVDRAEVTRLGEGLEQTGPADRSRSGAPSTRSRPWPTRRGGCACVDDRRGRHGRAAHRAEQQPRSSRPCATRCGVGIEVISGEEEAGSPTLR